MHEDTVFGHHADLQPAAGQQFVQLSVALAMQQRLHLGWRLVPTLLQRSLASMLGDQDIGGVQLAVANHLDLRDRRDLFADKLEDGASKVACDAPVGLRSLQTLGQEGVIKALSTRGKPPQLGHDATPRRTWRVRA